MNGGPTQISLLVWPLVNLAAAPLAKLPGMAVIKAGEIKVREGGVILMSGRELLAETRAMSPDGRVGWVGARFAVLDRREAHPIGCIRWPRGGAAHGNWLGA